MQCLLSLDSLKEDELEKDEVELMVNNDKIERELKYQYDRKKGVFSCSHLIRY
jgi:hypothetical protein